MRLRLNKSLTLIELLVSICILAIIAIGFNSIDIFSNYHVISADRRAKIQNEASYVFGHMAKEMCKTIGDVTASKVPVVIDDSNRRIKFYVDSNADGVAPGDGIWDTIEDRWRAYRYRDSSASESERYQIWYCPKCTDATCNSCTPEWGTDSHNTLSNKIISFIPTYDNTKNYLEIEITACWDPDGTPAACGQPENPDLDAKTRIPMPSVSTH